MELGNRMDWIRAMEGSCPERLPVFWFELLGGSAIQGNKKNSQRSRFKYSFIIFVHLFSRHLLKAHYML